MRSLACTIFIIACYFASSESISVEDAFNTFMIVPTAVPVAPSALLYVRFGNTTANLGNDLDPSVVPYPPYVWYEANPKKLYTFLIVDLDQPSILVPSASPYLSLLRINIPGNNINAGDYISPYVPPSPIPGSAYHRFVYLVYQQSERIDRNTPQFRALPGSFSNFPLNTFTSQYNLTKLIAGNFFISKMDICNSQPPVKATKCK